MASNSSRSWSRALQSSTSARSQGIDAGCIEGEASDQGRRKTNAQCSGLESNLHGSDLLPLHPALFSQEDIAIARFVYGMPPAIPLHVRAQLLETLGVVPQRARQPGACCSRAGKVSALLQLEHPVVAQKRQYPLPRITEAHTACYQPIRERLLALHQPVTRPEDRDA